ncbi:MAG: VWA domain-containing protein [Candidatus Woesearchaeota archaeon]
MKYLLILLIPLYGFLIYLLRKKYSKLFPTFFGVKLQNSKEDLIIFIINILLFSVLILIIIDPKLPIGNLEKTTNIVFVIDTSGSMNAEDFKPNRIEVAKQETINFIKSTKENDRLGIVGFSNYPYVISFLTINKDSAIKKLKEIEANGATNLGDALIMATDMVNSIDAHKKAIILLSDGVPNTGTPVEVALKYAKNKKVQIFTIAVGSQEKYIAGYDFFGNPQYEGVDFELLENIALETNGKAFVAKNNLDMNAIYRSLKEELLDKKEPRSVRKELTILFFILFIIYLILKIIYNIPY